jgi:hypothetical protein
MRRGGKFALGPWNGGGKSMRVVVYDQDDKRLVQCQSQVGMYVALVDGAFLVMVDIVVNRIIFSS